MSSQDVIDAILSQKTFAVAGVSRSGRGFGVTVYRHLRQRGYTVFALNRSAGTVDGERLYPDFASLPGTVDVLVTVVPPQETSVVVRDAQRAGITRVWMQQGSASDEAITWCRQQGMQVMHGECIMMFTAPVKGLHRVHRWIRSFTGTLPK